MKLRGLVVVIAWTAAVGALLVVAGPNATAAPQAAQATCRGVPATIVGSGELTGTSGRDVIVATRHEAKVRARGGNDLICGSRFVRGQAGADEIHYSGPATLRDDLYISGGTGDDVIRFHKRQHFTSSGTSVGIFGGPGDDLITGARGSLWFEGGSGNDRLVSGSGTHLLGGGGGDDVLLGGPAADLINGGAGDDLIRGRADTDELSGGRGHDEVWGGPDWDVCNRGNEIEHSCEADDWV